MGRVVRSGGLAVALLCVFASIASSQTASLTGYINDQTGAIVPNVSVVLTSETTGFTRQVQSNDDGLYSLVQLPPDRYTLLVERAGFQRVLRPNLALDAASTRRVDVVLAVGPVDDTVQVSAPARGVEHDTTGMGTLIRPDEVEHLAISGRSVQRLIALAPGTIPTSASSGLGEFSVHGQRASANYLTIDGVSGNVATEVAPAAGSTAWGNGTLPGFSPSGSSNSLFSLDAVEEVRIQTSSYAPEYGRMPGAQISVVTKSGSAKLSGSAYEYFRDDSMDATDFFVKMRGLPKPVTEFHTFGGTAGGPLGVPSLFFFGNYEGQRLTLPRFRSTGVPTQATRDRTSGGLRRLLDAYPLPNGPDLGGGVAEFALAVSDLTRADVGAVKVDYAPGAWRVFARVHAGSTEAEARGVSSSALSQMQHTTGRTITTTGGANLVVSTRWFVENRLNYTTNSFEAKPGFEVVNGAQLSEDLIGISGASDIGGSFSLTSGLTGNTISFGRGQGRGIQRQFNGIVSATTVLGRHSIKVGTDIRRLFPTSSIPDARVSYSLGSPTTLQGDLIGRVTVSRSAPADIVLTNVSLFAQDEWQVNQRLSATYGFRWDINPAPQTADDRRPYLVEYPEDPTRTRPRSSGDAALWRTDYRGIAPRVAASYRLSSQGGREQIVRAAAGLFFDMGWSNSTLAFGRGFPFNSSNALVNVRLPLDATSVPPLPAPTDPPGASAVYSFPEELSLPRSTQWLAGYEFTAGGQLAVGATYLGARGSHLTRTIRYDYGTASSAPYSRIEGMDTDGRSTYDALEMRLRVRPTSVLDGEISYTLARSEDNVSDDVAIGIPTSREDPDAGWGPSSFDARHALKWRVGVTTPSRDGLWRVFGNTSIYLSAFYQSALPGTPEYVRDIGFGTYIVRADVVPGVPVYLEDPSYPGGRRVNPDAFAVPVEARQGTAVRNSIRGFPLSQIDLAIKRRVPVSRIRLDVGLDVFNLFNRPQFAMPFLFVTTPAMFGLSNQTAANALGSGTNGRGLSPIFQPGGPRSIQLVLRASF